MYKRALLILAKTVGAASEDLTVIYYRTECTYRKAKIEAEFELLKSTHDEQRRINLARNEGAKLVKGGVVNGKAIRTTQARVSG